MENQIVTPNSPNVVSEDFEGEVILVNLINGNYYSLRNSAAYIWKHIEGNYSYQELLENVQAHYALQADSDPGVGKFVEDLMAQQLIRTEPLNGYQPKGTNGFETNQAEFEPPVLEVYSDMQDLLLLDPIHDVDEESGWPEKPKDGD